MRFLDVAVGSGYAAVCLSLIAMMSPVVSHQEAAQAASQEELDRAISAYVQHVGLPFLVTSLPAAICDSSAAASNSTIVIEAFAEEAACPRSSHPASPAAFSSLTLYLPTRTVVVEAWLVRR